MTEAKKPSRAARVMSGLVLLSLTASVVFTTVRLIQAPSAVPEGVEHMKVKSDYTLMLIQCLLGLGVWSLPSLLNQRLDIRLPNSFLTMYFVFLYCAVFLGEVRNFYYTVPHWDTVLHAFSGMMLGVLGFSVVLLLNDNRSQNVHLTPAFVALFAFCFAVTLGVIWEIYEFAVDGTLGLNMQKYMLESHAPKLGRDALMDTMKDLVVDLLGAGLAAGIGFVLMKRRPDWLYHFDLRKGQTAPSTRVGKGPGTGA